MGLFDFLRRKPESAPEFEGFEFDEPRCHHYTLAHVALRQMAHDDPVAFLGILASPKAPEFLAEVFRSVSDHCRERDPRPDFTAADLTIHRGRVGRYPCAVVQMPPPKGPTEAFFAAAVLLVDPEQPMPPRESVKARYFTLEKGVTLGGPPRTVLCEWTADGTHSNFGDGPPARLEAFVAALERFVSEKA